MEVVFVGDATVYNIKTAHNTYTTRLYNSAYNITFRSCDA